MRTCNATGHCAAEALDAELGLNRSLTACLISTPLQHFKAVFTHQGDTKAALGGACNATHVPRIWQRCIQCFWATPCTVAWPT